MADRGPSGTGHDTAAKGEIVDFEALCASCGHAAKLHHPMTPLRTCAAMVYTDAPIGGGSCYPCRCRGFVPPDPLVAVPGPASEPACHCGRVVEPRDPDPWEGRMDDYCECCAWNRCDCYPDECPVKHPAPGPASVSPAEPGVRYNAPGIGPGRAWLCCLTCRDNGMVEDETGREDVCPTCEGGLWRERESWFSWINRHLPGFRLARGLPPFYRTSKP